MDENRRPDQQPPDDEAVPSDGMHSLPGMLGEVCWGHPGNPLPDWRAHQREHGADDDDDDKPLTDEERERLIGKTGLDPDELWPDDDGSDDESRATDQTE